MVKTTKTDSQVQLQRLSDSIDRINNHPLAKQYLDFSSKEFDSVEEKGIQAMFLDNCRKIMDSEQAQSFMTVSNFGPFLPELWPVITAYYPEFPLKELISLQPMKEDLAYLVVSELLIGRNKADSSQGDKVETPMGPRTIRGRYPTGEIFGEVIPYEQGAGQEYALAFAPVMTSQGAPIRTNVAATGSIHRGTDALLIEVYALDGNGNPEGAPVNVFQPVSEINGVITFNSIQQLPATIEYPLNATAQLIAGGYHWDTSTQTWVLDAGTLPNGQTATGLTPTDQLKTSPPTGGIEGEYAPGTNSIGTQGLTPGNRGVGANLLPVPEGTPKTCTLELETGILTFTDGGPDSGQGIVANYVWNIEYAGEENIPTIVEDMSMVAIQAEPRAIAMKWTIFSEYVKKSQFGDDIRSATTKRVLDLIYQYQTRYVLDRLYTQRARPGSKLPPGANVDYVNALPKTLTATQIQQWSGLVPPEPVVTFYAGLSDLYTRIQDLNRQMNLISQYILDVTGRMEGNKVVCGSGFKVFLESLPDNYYKSIAQPENTYKAPRKIGTFGKYDIFYDDTIPADQCYMTYRGSQWYDAAYYFGVFMPVTPTDIVNIYIDVKTAFVSMEGHYYQKPWAVRGFRFAYSSYPPDPIPSTTV